MAQQWYYSRDGKEHGPLSAAVLFAMAQKGELLPTDLLWKDGTESRRPAADFPKLFAKGGTPPSQMPQRDSLSSGTAIVGLSGSRSTADDPADARQDQSPDSPSADPSSLKGLTMALGIEPAKPGQDALLGCDIGGVTIVRLIAEGGMGRVYEGKQEKPNRTVAVKVMRPGLTSPSVLKRFEYEAEVLGRLQHPGIAHIYSVGVHRMGNASVPYFIMEYIADARTLTKYANDLKLPVRQRLDLFRSVCDAVAHGHQKGVIHRDLKPSNILVDGSGQPKVIDFGVARATDSDMALTTMQTDVGQLIGTLQYMSPEQFKADPNDIDVRSDVYALGVILYELLAGKLPYDIKKKAIHEVARIVQEDDPTPLSSFNRGLKGDVAVIAGKCLEKERGRRYSSASELGSDIGKYLTGEPISASPPGFIDGLVRLARKHRAAAAAVAGVFVALVLAMVGISIYATRAERERSVAIQERDRANMSERDAAHARALAETQRDLANVERRVAEQATATAREEKARADAETQNAQRRLYVATLGKLNAWLDRPERGMATRLFEETETQYRVLHGKESRTPLELALLRPLLDESLLVLKGRSSGVAFSPDGRCLATSSDGNIRICDVKTGTACAVLAKPKESKGVIPSRSAGRSAGWEPPPAYAPDGLLVASASEQGTVYIWDVSTAIMKTALHGHKNSISSLVFSSDGARLATGSSDHTARVWDVAAGKEALVLQGHSQPITSVALSPDGTRVATASWDSTVRLWDASTGQELRAIRCGAHSVGFSPDGGWLATGRQAGALLFNTKTGERVMELTVPHLLGAPMLPTSLAFSPDGTRLATVGDYAVHVWDLDTGRELTTLLGHRGLVTAVAYSPDGTRIATASDFGVDAGVRVWDASREPSTALQGREVGISPDGKVLLTVMGDGNVCLWDSASCTRTQLFPLNTPRIVDIACSPDGTLFATRAHEDTAVRVWDVATGRPARALQGEGGSIQEFAFSPNGKELATVAKDDGSIRIWDLGSCKERACIKEHGANVTVMAFSPDGKRLATGGSTSGASGLRAAVHLLDIATGERIRSLDPEAFFVTDLAFSPDGDRLAIGSLNPDVLVWNCNRRSDKADLILKGHMSRVEAVAFSSDGTRLVTGSEDRTVRIWDAQTGDELAVLDGFSGAVWEVAINADSNALVTRTSDGRIRVWGLANSDVFRKRLAGGRATTEFQRNREVAEWVLRAKGKIQVLRDGKPLSVSDENSLPAEPLLVTAIDMTGNGNATDETLALLRGLNHLEVLKIGGTRVTDEVMEHIITCETLKHLSVNWTRVTGRGLARLKKAKLTFIDASGGQDMAAAMPGFRRMGTLEVLIINSCQMSEAIVEDLLAMTSLKKLNFNQKDFPPDVVERLRSGMPNCRIHLY